MPAPKRANTAAATRAAAVAARRRKLEAAAKLIRDAGGTATLPGDRSEKSWNVAVDWLLNSRHTADPDIQDAFWALADGVITEDEVESLGTEEIRKRRAAAGD